MSGINKQEQVGMNGINKQVTRKQPHIETYPSKNVYSQINPTSPPSSCITPPALKETKENLQRKLYEQKIDNWLKDISDKTCEKDRVKALMLRAYDLKLSSLKFYSVTMGTYNIPSVPPLDELTQITELDLSCQQLTHIEGSLFHGLKNLKTLDLSENKIESMINLDMSNLTELVEINFDRNKLREVENVNFSGCRKLRSFKIMEIHYMKGSYLEMVFNINFTGCEQLRSFTLSYLSNLKLMANIFLSGCIHLEELNLSNNPKAIIGYFDFNQCTELSTIDLKNNRLQTIPEWDLTPCTKLRTVILDSNRSDD